jgi:alkyl sulfatase BDS1-like metallo-beta-lactamase superfamily hydrolase
VAPTLVELTGGTESIVVKARDFLQSQKPLEALHLLDIVLAAEPDLPSGREAKKEALNQLLEQTGGNNLWERMWIDAAIRDTQS